MKNRIIALLEMVSVPQSIERIVQIVSPDQEQEIRSAILDLIMEGKLSVCPEGVAIAPSDQEEEPMGFEDDEEWDFKQAHADTVDFEQLQGSECQEGVAVESAAIPEIENESTESAENDDLPAWPWPELADAPFDEALIQSQMSSIVGGPSDVADLPAWPWPELSDAPFDESMLAERSYYNSNGEETRLPNTDTNKVQDGQTNEMIGVNRKGRKTQLYQDDSIDQLSLPRNSITKLRESGLATIADLVGALDAPSFQALSKYVQSRAIQELRESCATLRYSCDADHIAGLRSVFGNRSFIFDIFGMLTFAPSSQNLEFSAQHTRYEVSASTSLDSVIKDPVLIRRLRVGGIVTLEDLLSKSDDELLSIKGFGLSKLEKVRKALTSAGYDNSGVQIHGLQDGKATQEEMLPTPASLYSGDAMALVLDALDILDPDSWVFWPEGFVASMAPVAERALSDCPENPCAAFIDAFWAMDGIVEASVESLPRILDMNSVECESAIEAKFRLPHAVWEPVIQELVDGGVWDYDLDSEMVFNHRPTLSEWMDSLEGRDREILELRMNGATLAEVGEKLDLTRERVRQLQARLLDKRPALQEDAYLHLVNAYSMTAQVFSEITGLDEMAYGYLDLLAPRPKSDRLSASEMLHDPVVSDQIKQAFSNTKTEGQVLVYGKAVPARKLDITKAILAEKGETVSPAWLLEEYENVVTLNNEQENSALSPKNQRAYEAWLVRQPGILYAPLPKYIDEQDRSVRLYDDAVMDFDTLVNYLESDEFQNMSCSAKLIFERESFSCVREELDIRNEYELHAIIRRFCGQVRHLSLGRCPMLSFGN